MSKYYLSQTAGQLLKVGQHQIKFDPCKQSAGCVWGVYKADDKKIIKELDAIVGTRGVAKIKKSEYEDWLKKKQPLYNSRIDTAINQSRPDPKPEKVAEPVKPKSIEELTGTESINRPNVGELAFSYKQLSDKLDVQVDDLKKLAKNEDFPKRSKKGWHVKEVKAYLEGQG